MGCTSADGSLLCCRLLHRLLRQGTAMMINKRALTVPTPEKIDRTLHKLAPTGRILTIGINMADYPRFFSRIENQTEWETLEEYRESGGYQALEKFIGWQDLSLWK